MAKTKIERLNARFNDAKSLFDPHVSTYRDIAKYVYPTSGAFLYNTSGKGRQNFTYSEAMKNMINNIAISASETFVSGMISGMTSPATKWFEAQPFNRNLMDVKGVPKWFEEVTNIMMEILRSSNFYDILPVFWEETGNYGQCPVMCVEDFENVVAFKTFTIGEYYITQNSKMKVDSMFRKFSMSVRQMVEQFGKDAVGKNVNDDYENDRLENTYDVYHAYMPNNGDFKGFNKDKPFISIYWLKEDEHILEEKGYEEESLFCPRWKVNTSTPYAIMFPARAVLNDVKALIREEKQLARNNEMNTNPPMQVPGGGKNVALKMMPGTISVTNEQPARSLWESNNYSNDLRIDINAIEKRIDRGFNVDLFNMISMIDRSGVTATEIRARQNEKLLKLGAIMPNFETDFLSLVLEKVFNMAQRAGILPPAPPALEGQAIRMTFSNIFRQAQKAEKVKNIQALLEFVASVASLDPSIIQTIDLPAAIREVADGVDAPATIILEDERYQEILAAQAEAARVKRQGESMIAATQGAKNLAQSPMGEGNALEAVANGSINLGALSGGG